MNEIPSIV